MKDYRKLQNGSDIRGIAITGVPGELPNLTPYEAADIGRGFVAWLCEKLGKAPQDMTVAIGRDPRISGKRLMEGLMNGIGPYGVKAYDCGLASTPAMFMSTVFPEFSCDAAVMITASHLPYNRNGFKFFTGEGGLDKADITAILRYAGDEELCREKLGEPDGADSRVRDFGKLVYPMEERDLMGRYCKHLRKLIVDGAESGEKPLAGMKIVVDAGNGSGGFFAKKVLKPLGADISDSQYLEPDGMFSNHAPNPEDADAINALMTRVVSRGADFGLIFDTDVDRSAAVDGRGREIARNGIVAMAAALVAKDHPGTTVVTDSITSRQLTDFLEKELGLKHLRFKRGYKNVINKAKELNEQGVDCQLAIETSGHAAFKENYFLDDGAYLAVKIVTEAARMMKQGRTFDSLIEKLQYPAEEKEIRIPITAADFGACGDEVLAKLKDFIENMPAGAADDAAACAAAVSGERAGGEDESGGAETGGCENSTGDGDPDYGAVRDVCSEISLEEPNYEGVRINFADGWCLLRKSLHDPIMPLNIASDEAGGCERIESFMSDFLSSFDSLDLSVMQHG